MAARKMRIMHQEDVRKKIQCSQCNQLADPSKVFYIDKIPFCSACLYGDLKPFEIYPIGFVRNNLDRELDREFGLVGNPREESRIELLPSQKAFMYKLEEEEFLTIVYYFHKHKPPRSKFRRKKNGGEQLHRLLWAESAICEQIPSTSR